MPNPEDLNRQNPDLPEALRNLELASLTNSPRAIWYEAGVVAGGRRATQWRSAAVAFAAIAVAVSLARWPTRSPQLATSSHAQPAVISSSDLTAPTASQAYTRLLDSLTQPDAARAHPESPADVAGQPDPEPGLINRISPTGCSPISDRG